MQPASDYNEESLEEDSRRVYVGESVQKNCGASVLAIENGIPLDELNDRVSGREMQSKVSRITVAVHPILYV